MAVYLKGEKNVEVKNRIVSLCDIVEMESPDKALLEKLKLIRIMKIPEKGKSRHVISILKVVECIHEKFPDAEVRNLGEKDIIVTYKEEKPENMPLKAAKTISVALITFFGAAFSIMAFHNDVSISKLFAQIYFWLTGSYSDGFTVLETAYSAGVTAGILVFFSHFSKKKFTVDPTPVEVQMRLYENDIQTALIENAARKEKETNAGCKDNSGGDRA